MTSRSQKTKLIQLFGSQSSVVDSGGECCSKKARSKDLPYGLHLRISGDIGTATLGVVIGKSSGAEGKRERVSTAKRARSAALQYGLNSLQIETTSPPASRTNSAHLAHALGSALSRRNSIPNAVTATLIPTG